MIARIAQAAGAFWPRSRRTGYLGLAALACLAIAVLTLTGPSRPLAGTVALTLLTALAAAGAFSLAALSLDLVPRAERPRETAGDVASYAGSLDQGLLLARDDGGVSFANAAFYRLIDRAEGSLRSFTPADLGSLSAHAGGGAVYRLTRALAAGDDLEELIEQPTGRKANAGSRWLRISLTHHEGTQGKRFAAWRLEDVTQEHTRQTESLARLKRNLDGLDALPAGLFIAAPDGRLTYVNATLAEWTGAPRKPGDISGLTLDRLFSAEGHAQLRRVSLASGPGAVIADDADIVREDGVRVPVSVMLRGRQPDGSIALGAVLSRAPGDRSEEHPGTAEARFTRLFHAAPVAIATMDVDGRIGSANPAFSRQFFRGGTALSASGLDIMDGLAPASRTALAAGLAKLRSGDALPGPIDIAFGPSGTSSGQLFLARNAAAAAAERESIILYALDTTERKELEAQFAQSQKMQAIGQLAGGIAHDINNVLTVIIGFSDLLLANSAGDPAFHDLVEIKSNANRAANLVRQLLAFSRRQTLRPEVLSMNEVISDLTVFLKRSLGEKVKLEPNYGRDLWLVKADQTELSRVFLNLAVNASDAMPSGGTVTVRTANITQADSAKLSDRGFSPGEYVLIAVTDTGHGMTADVLEKIFEPFFTTKDVGKGTGLGLSTVYGIVKQTGGYIFCDSASGKGTTFRIYLPRHVPGSGSIEVAPKVADKKEKGRDVTGTGTVLLVEDEDAVRKFAARALRRQGYNVLEAGNGIEALAVKAGHAGAIDLVVSDIVMPEMDGPTLLKELRGQHPDLRFIFMSGYADDALSSLDGGEEFAFLPKPFQLADLVTKVKEVIGG